MVRPTKFDKKYSLIRFVTAKTKTGGTKKSTETVVFTDWCNKKPVTGQKRMDYSSLNYRSPFTLKVRKRTDNDILYDDNIRLGSDDFQIRSIYETEDQMYLIIDVSK